MPRNSVSVSAKPTGTPLGAGRRVGAWLLQELREMVAPTIFFAIGFNLIVLTMHLILADYLIAFGNFMLATTSALVVGKAVLIANAMPFLRRYDRAPLIQPILFKTAIYWTVVFLARLLEDFAEFCAVKNNSVGDFLSHLITDFSWHRFAAIQLWILVLFLIYVTASELNDLFGDGELWRILFTYRSSELQLNRRQRIRELICLSRLADAHSMDDFRDPTSTAYNQLIDIVRRLAR
jgi:hypothetical protein